MKDEDSTITYVSSDEASTVSDRACDSVESTLISKESKSEPLLKKQVSTIEEPKANSSIAGVSANLMNTIVGSGIVGVPFAFQQSGYIAGLVLMIMVAYMTTVSLQMLINLAMFSPKLKNLGVRTYEDMFMIPFGKMGRRVILAALFICSYGPNLSYLLILKQALGMVLDFGDSFVDREVPMLIVALVLILPLCLLRDISRLAFTSMISIIAELALIIIVACYSPIASNVASAGGLGTVLEENWINSGLFVGLGIISSSMTCQQASFNLAGSLSDKTPRRWAAATRYSVWSAALLNLIMGTVGFFGFLDETNGDILTNFPSDSVGINVGRILLSCTMVLTFPIMFFILRQVFLQLFFEGKLKETTTGPDGIEIPKPKLLGCFGQFEMYSILLFLSIIIPALFVRDLGPVLSFVGAIGSSCLAYIAPGLAYLGINGREFLTCIQKFVKKESCKNSPAICDVNVNANAEASVLRIPSGGKPLWWWAGGFPLWAKIAVVGGNNTDSFLKDFHIDCDERSQVDEERANKIASFTVEAPKSAEDISIPRFRDFMTSIYFVVFGVIAMVAGVGSTIILIVN